MGKLIDQQVVIDAIVNTVSEIGLHDNSEVARYGATFRQHEIIDIIEKLPPAQPEPPEDICGECDAWNKYKSEHKTGRWIPCSERLPDDGRVVLWCNEHGSVFTSAITVRVGKSWAIGKKHRLSEIIAWMPLPDPYKPKEKNDACD